MKPAPSPTLSPAPEGAPAPGDGQPGRRVPDRRRRPTPMLSRYLFHGRRRGGRRDGEIENVYVDHPGVGTLWAIAIVSILSLADAGFTLYEVSQGGTEANPVMRAALSLGNAQFILIKTFMTVVGALFLGLHKNWKLGRICLWCAVAGYTLLTLYHGYGILFYLPGLSDS